MNTLEQSRSDFENPTKIALLEAAKRVLLAQGFAGLSTRAIAQEAATQMSQIRYHFGSKEGMVLALYEYMTHQLIDRQTRLFTDPHVPISQKWFQSCDYLEQDLKSGYVRVLQELIAVGWANDTIGNAVRQSLTQWRDLHISLAREFAEKSGDLGPFEAEDIAALVASAFIGAEALVLLGYEDMGVPIRRALRRFGTIIEQYEKQLEEG